jgi:hypothetical protein
MGLEPTWSLPLQALTGIRESDNFSSISRQLYDVFWLQTSKPPIVEIDSSPPRKKLKSNAASPGFAIESFCIKYYKTKGD